MSDKIGIFDDDSIPGLTHIIIILSVILLTVMPSRESLIFCFIAILNLNAKKWFDFIKTKKNFSDHEKLDAIQLEIKRLDDEFKKLNAAMTFHKIGRS